MTFLAEVVFGCVETQLQGMVPPLPGLASARSTNWVFWDIAPLPSSVAGTDPNLSLGSTQVTALQETEEGESGLLKEPLFFTPLSFCTMYTFCSSASIISEAFKS